MPMDTRYLSNGKRQKKRLFEGQPLKFKRHIEFSQLTNEVAVAIKNDERGPRSEKMEASRLDARPPECL